MMIIARTSNEKSNEKRVESLLFQIGLFRDAERLLDFVEAKGPFDLFHTITYCLSNRWSPLYFARVLKVAGSILDHHALTRTTRH